MSRSFKNIAWSTMKNTFGDISRRPAHGPAGPMEISQPQRDWYPWQKMDFALKGRWNPAFEFAASHFRRPSGTGYYFVSVIQPLRGWLISSCPFGTFIRCAFAPLR